MKFLKIAIVSLLIVLSLQGCFKQIADKSEALPNIIWPKPPEIPRIKFVNAISKPDDFGIMESTFDKFFRYFTGTKTYGLVTPYGITSDEDGRLLVVDSFRRNVFVFDLKNNDFYTFQEDETSFDLPIDIAIDNNGTIYISDSIRGVVKVFSDHGKRFVKDIGAGILSRPTGIAFNRKTNELLVVDTKNSEIVMFDIELHKFKGTIGLAGTAEGSFHSPTNIFTDIDGQIFVSDSLNFRIQIFSHDGKFIRSFGNAGDGPGYFARPRGVATDSDDNIYVVDALFDNVQIFNKHGNLLMAFGGPGNDYGKFWLPSGIFIDSGDRIYVSDSYNHRVQIFQYIKTNELPRQVK